jgi:hypothetical protein
MQACKVARIGKGIQINNPTGQVIFQQGTNEVAANKSGPACYQNIG